MHTLSVEWSGGGGRGVLMVPVDVKIVFCWVFRSLLNWLYLADVSGFILFGLGQWVILPVAFLL